MKEELILKCEDDPESHGKKAKSGDVRYEMRFPLEDGRELVVLMGQKGWDHVTQHTLDMLAETPSYGDGTTNMG